MVKTRALGEAVRPRTAGRDLDVLDTGVCQDRVERRRELPGAIAKGNRNRVARLPRSMTSLRACWVVQGPSGWSVTPRTWR